MKKKLSLLMALSMGVCSVQPIVFTANAEEEAPVKAIVRFYDSETNEDIENIVVKALSYNEYYEDENGFKGNHVVIDEWNTSNSNPHFIRTDNDFIDENGELSYYISATLPKGYSYRNYSDFSSYKKMNHNIEVAQDSANNGYFANGIDVQEFINYASVNDEGTVVFDIPVDHHPATQELVYPVKDSVKYSFDIIDRATNEPIENVKVTFCKLESYARMDKVKKVISEWTYKQGDVIEIPVEFENNLDFNYYGFKVEGLPENYVFETFPEYRNEFYISQIPSGYNNAKYSTETPKLILYAANKDSVVSPVNTGIKTTATSGNSTVTQNTATTVINNLKGDANCDGAVNIADATAITQYLGNKDKYPLSEQGLENADCYNTGDGVTGLDAMTIQKLEAKLITALPDKS